MSHESTYDPQSGVEKWLDKRLPLVRLMYDSFVDFNSSSVNPVFV